MGVMSAFVHGAALEDVTHTGPAIFELAGDDPSGGMEGVPDVVRVPVVVVPAPRDTCPTRSSRATLSARPCATTHGPTSHALAAAGGLSRSRIRMRRI